MKSNSNQYEVSNFTPETINISQNLSAGLTKYDISDQQLQDKNVIGLFVRRYGANRKTINNVALAAEAAYQCAFLTIKDNNTTILDRTPLEFFMGDIVQNYVPINFPNGIRNKEIILDFSDSGAVQASTAIELIFIVESPNRTC